MRLDSQLPLLREQIQEEPLLCDFVLELNEHII